MSAFIILGHGFENYETNFDSRETLPEGYTLVTFQECNTLLWGGSVQQIKNLFLRPEMEEIIKNPSDHKREILEFLNHRKNLFSEDLIEVPGMDKLSSVRVYHSGYKIPNLSIQAIADIDNSHYSREKGFINYASIFNSGLYRFPLNPDLFALHHSRSTINPMFDTRGFDKKGPPDELKTLDPSAVPKIVKYFTDSVFPTKEAIAEILSTSPNYREFKRQITYPLSAFMRAGGPGVYYHVACREGYVESEIDMPGFPVFSYSHRERLPYSNFLNTHGNVPYNISAIPFFIPQLEKFRTNLLEGNIDLANRNSNSNSNTNTNSVRKAKRNTRRKKNRNIVMKAPEFYSEYHKKISTIRRKSHNQQAR